MRFWRFSLHAAQALTITSSLAAALLWLASARTPLANLDTIQAEIIEAARYSADAAMAACAAAAFQAFGSFSAWRLRCGKVL